MTSTAARTSCAAASDALVLADGTHLRFRPLGIGDRDGLAALFARLSPESRRRRFFVAKHELTPRELAYLTDIDHLKHEAVAAVDERDGSIVGVARYAQFPDRPGVADVAVEVADELQGMGIGTELTRRTVMCARENGFTLLTATTLWENRPARALLRRLGFRARASHGSEIELELKLAPDPRPQLPAGSITGSQTKRRNTMIGVSVTFQYDEDFDRARVVSIAKNARKTFGGMPGLRSKAFTVDDARQRAMNFYIWESADSARSFFSEEMRERVTGLYGVEPTIDFVEIAQLVDNSHASHQG